MIVCTACGDPCTVVTIDNGVGHYEYWGAPGFHTDIHEVSQCCEADYDELEDMPVPEGRWINEEDIEDAYSH